MYSSDRHRVFKSLETDREFQDRIFKEKGLSFRYDFGKDLDDLAWSACKMQRRLIERSTEQHATR